MNKVANRGRLPQIKSSTFSPKQMNRNGLYFSSHVTTTRDLASVAELSKVLWMAQTHSNDDFLNAYRQEPSLTQECGYPRDSMFRSASKAANDVKLRAAQRLMQIMTGTSVADFSAKVANGISFEQLLEQANSWILQQLPLNPDPNQPAEKITLYGAILTESRNFSKNITFKDARVTNGAAVSICSGNIEAEAGASATAEGVEATATAAADGAKAYAKKGAKSFATERGALAFAADEDSIAHATAAGAKATATTAGASAIASTRGAEGEAAAAGAETHALAPGAAVYASADGALASAVDAAKAFATSNGAKAFAMGEYAQAFATESGAEAHAMSRLAIAYALVAGAKAYASDFGALAHALAAGAIATAIAYGAKAYADEDGAIANATADGAKSYATAAGAEAHATTAGAIAQGNILGAKVYPFIASKKWLEDLATKQLTEQNDINLMRNLLNQFKVDQALVYQEKTMTIPESTTLNATQISNKYQVYRSAPNQVVSKNTTAGIHLVMVNDAAKVYLANGFETPVELVVANGGLVELENLLKGCKINSGIGKEIVLDELRKLVTNEQLHEDYTTQYVALKGDTGAKKPSVYHIYTLTEMHYLITSSAGKPLNPQTRAPITFTDILMGKDLLTWLKGAGDKEKAMIVKTQSIELIELK